MKEQGIELAGEWRREALKLRQNRWGGQLAIVAYSLMLNRRSNAFQGNGSQHVCP